MVRISADRITDPSKRVFLSGLFAVLLSAHAQACPICGAMPTKTVADHLIESETIVLAREDADRPFTYSLVKVLRGRPPAGPFDLFVNSATRRRLTLNPGEAVVLVRKGKDQGWQSLGIADKDVPRGGATNCAVCRQVDQRGRCPAPHRVLLVSLRSQEPFDFRAGVSGTWPRALRNNQTNGGVHLT